MSKGMKFKTLSLIAAMILISLNSRGQEPKKTSVAVYPIKAIGGVDKSLAATLTSLLNNDLTQSPKLLVIKESMLEEVMKRQAINISDLCDDTVCQVEIGKLVQAQKMVVGELAKLGSLTILTLDLIDIQSGANEFSNREQCACAEEQLLTLTAVAAAKIRNHFGESVPIPALPQAAAALALLPAQPLATTSPAVQKTFQEFHPPGAKGGPMVYVSDFKFYIDKFEVTNQDYQECVSAGVCQEIKKRSGFDAANQPVVFVTQQEARTYCQWAGKRLPFGAEWENAATGTDGRKYPWGNQEPDCTLANYRACKIGRTLPVGSKPAGASPYGAMDMAGNAWEWVEEKDVLRGGGWGFYATFLRVNDRRRNLPLDAWDPVNTYGFRCARD